MIRQSRYLLKLLAVLFVVLLLGAIGYTQDMMYQEAPMLAEQVAAGELPPVEERLPGNPLVVGPLNEIGTYGGNLAPRYSRAHHLHDLQHDL